MELIERPKNQPVGTLEFRTEEINVQGETINRKTRPKISMGLAYRLFIKVKLVKDEGNVGSFGEMGLKELLIVIDSIGLFEHDTQVVLDESHELDAKETVEGGFKLLFY